MKTMNPELLPLIEWWEKEGKQTIAMLAVAAVAVGGWYGWKAHKAAVRDASSQALVNAYTTEEIEDAVSKFGGTATGGALKLRLAKNYYDNARYEEAMAIYDELAAAGAPEGFADIPVVGKAQCLEGLGRFAEAQAAFDAFAETNAGSYLALTAQLGAARALAEAGDRAKALERLAALKTENAEDALAKARVEATEDAVRRFNPTIKSNPGVTK